jgi:hypothetical protein
VDRLTLQKTLDEVLSQYQGEAFNGHVFLTHDMNKTHYVLTGIGTLQHRRIVNTAAVIQIMGEKIIIERDQNSKPLFEALLQAGVPRTQIVLAYAGEPVPER